MKRPLLPAGLTALDAATVLARWLLGGLFLYMGCRKALHPDLFHTLLHEYQMVQSPLALNFLAIALPWVEIFCGFQETLINSQGHRFLRLYIQDF